MADTVNNSNSTSEAVAATEAAPVVVEHNNEALARAEKRLHTERKAMQAEKAEWKAKLAQYETGYIPKARFNEDPIAALTEAGVSYDQLTELLLNQPNMSDPATKAIMNKLKQLEERSTRVEREAADREVRARQDAEKAISQEITVLVDSDSAYETIKAAGCEDQVLTYIIDTYDKTGKLLNVADACKHIEDYLVDEGYKFSQLNKIKARLTPKTEEQVSSANEPKQSQLKTLTNAVSSSKPTRLTEKDRVARAMAAFKGELK